MEPTPCLQQTVVTETLKNRVFLKSGAPRSYAGAVKFIPPVFFKKTDGTEIGWPKGVPQIREAIRNKAITPETEVYHKKMSGDIGESWTAKEYLEKYEPEHRSQKRVSIAVIVGIVLLGAGLILSQHW